MVGFAVVAATSPSSPLHLRLNIPRGNGENDLTISEREEGGELKKRKLNLSFLPEMAQRGQGRNCSYAPLGEGKIAHVADEEAQSFAVLA